MGFVDNYKNIEYHQPHSLNFAQDSSGPKKGIIVELKQIVDQSISRLIEK